MAKGKSEDILEIKQIDRGLLRVNVLGSSPLLCNRMSQKVWRELLLPAKKKNRTEREAALKHDPLAEYQASPYTIQAAEAPTLIAIPGASFKRALASAAIDLGGTKAQIGRLAWVQEELVPTYGIPQLYMAITRSRDINRTPDVRTRAILPSWAATFHVAYVKPILKEQELAQLIAGSGEFIGVGDGRPEKGALSYGRFELVNDDDPRLLALRQQGGREAQVEALASPEPYDQESEDMLQWFYGEAKRRELKPTRPGNGEARV